MATAQSDSSLEGTTPHSLLRLSHRSRSDSDDTAETKHTHGDDSGDYLTEAEARRQQAIGGRSIQIMVMTMQLQHRTFLQIEPTTRLLH
jgi:hypothetical protein